MVFIRNDPCGIVCIILTYGAVFYADYVVVIHLAIPSLSSTLWGALHTVAFNTIVFLLTAAHLRAVFADPGMIPLPKTELDFSDLHSGQKKVDKQNGWSVCMKCETYRPPRAHHCRICRRCIKKMDHHCPWINNCVGEYNQRFFIQFLFYVGLLCLYSMAMVTFVWIADPQAEYHWSKHSRVVHSVALVVESILFGLFVIAIGCDQFAAILGDETAIEQLKKSGPQRLYKSSTALLIEVFGRGPMWLWMCPISTRNLTIGTPEHEYASYTV